MNSAETEFTVGSVVVKSCNRSSENNVACHCAMLLTQTNVLTNSPKQAWFNAHDRAGEILEIYSNRRCVLKFQMLDGTTWRSPATDLRWSTIFRDGWPNPPHRLLMPIAVIKEEVAHRLSDDESDPDRSVESGKKTRETTLNY